MRTDSGDTTTAMVCTECARSLETCAFCDRTECGSASCYACLVVALHQSLKQPHAHGG